MASTHSKRVFISYRRDDAAPHARNIEQALNERFGEDRVFLDQRDIEAGVEFPRRIAETLNASDVVVVVIGSKWENIKDGAGQRRLDNPQDFVRIEIATALQSGKRVIPVLVDDAQMPRAEALPTLLARLAHLNALMISNQRILEDVAHLVDAVEGRSPQERAWKLLLRALVVGLLIAPLLFFLLGKIRFFEGFFGLDIHLESLLAAYSTRQDTPALRERIALVVIDADSQRRLGIRPDDPTAWRAQHARLIRTLTTAGVRMIVFDLRFDGVSDDDELVLKALQEAKRHGVPVIAGVTSFDPQGDPISDAGFKDAITAWGHACIGMKNYALPTVNLALLRKHGGIVRSLSLAAAQHSATAESPFRIESGHSLQIMDGTGSGNYVAFPVAAKLDSAQTDGCEAQSAGDTAFPLRFDPSPRKQLRSPDVRIAYASLVEHASETDLSAFKNKIVIVGQGNDANERFDVERGATREARLGFELQADAIRTLLDVKSVHDVLRPLDTPWQAVLITAVCVLGMLLALVSGPLQSVWRVLLLCACVVAYGALASLVYRETRIVLPLSYPIAASLLTFFATRNAFNKGMRL